MNGEEPVGNKGYCYIFLPTMGDDVLYVGATKDISCRLYQHFVCGGNDYNQDKYNEVACVIFCEANTTAEAFLIEAVLIDLLRPKWNVMDPCKKKDLPLGYISSLPWHFIHSMNLRNESGDYARNEIIKSVDHALTGLNKFAADEFFKCQQERLQKPKSKQRTQPKQAGRKLLSRLSKGQNTASIMTRKKESHLSWKSLRKRQRNLNKKRNKSGMQSGY